MRTIVFTFSYATEGTSIQSLVFFYFPIHFFFAFSFCRGSPELHSTTLTKYLFSIFFCYSLKNDASCLTRKSGCSSGIQCPERGTMPPRTSVAGDFIEVNDAFPVYAPLSVRTG